MLHNRHPLRCGLEKPRYPTNITSLRMARDILDAVDDTQHNPNVESVDASVGTLITFIPLPTPHLRPRCAYQACKPRLLGRARDAPTSFITVSAVKLSSRGWATLILASSSCGSRSLLLSGAAHTARNRRARVLPRSWRPGKTGLLAGAACVDANKRGRAAEPNLPGKRELHAESNQRGSNTIDAHESAHYYRNVHVKFESAGVLDVDKAWGGSIGFSKPTPPTSTAKGYIIGAGNVIGPGVGPASQGFKTALQKTSR